MVSEKGDSLDGSGELTGSEDLPFRGPDTDNMREIARTLSDVSQRTGSATSKYGDYENPVGSNNPRLDPSSPEFDSEYFARNMFRLFRSDPERYPEAKLGVAFRNLEAHGVSQDVNYQVNSGNLPIWAFQQLVELVGGGRGTPVEILKQMDGCIKPGELCVVLGRPGAGCSTFLRTIATQTYGFSIGKESQISYMGLTPEEIHKTYRGEVTYCPESELHFPTLTVGDTLEFAARLKTPSNRIPGLSRNDYALLMRDVVMAMYGLSHTVNTRVGNDLVRGVSGGERKRVSIAELSLTGSSLQCWDNSTRGLDSATALEFIRTLRLQAETAQTTSLVAVYQASDEMYSLFDKTIVLYEGYEIFFGPISKAKQFFYDMGWQPKPRQSIPDFLTSLSQPSEREPREGFEDRVPSTAKEFYKLWKESNAYKECVSEADTFIEQYCRDSEATNQFELSLVKRKDKRLPRSVPYTVSWHMQIKELCIRGWKRMRGSPEMTLTTLFGQVIMAFVIASMFYNTTQQIPYTTGSFYSRTALIFFALLFNAFSSQLEIFAVFEARPVVQKHHMYAFYHPTVDALASILTESPARILTSLLFNVIIYFLGGLRREPGNFFFFLLMCFFCTLFMSHLFRTVAAVTNSVPEAMVPATVVLLAMTIFTGFVIPVNRMHGWCRWINYLDPLAYAYESLMTNEFHNYHYECSSFAPLSPSDGAQGRSFVCDTTGAQPGETTVLGDDYIGAQYEYYMAHQWRNIGIVIGFIFFLLGTYLLLIYVNPGARTKGEVLVFPYAALRRKMKESKAGKGSAKTDAGNVNAKEIERQQQEVANELLEASDDIFYWKDVCYDIKIKKEPRRLLNYVDGWVKPGTTTALMGATGAGKTTLLDTLANRVSMGVVHGQLYVNGVPRDNGFQRTTGYCMQQDLHLETATVREALEFSAVLRQPYSVPKAEKLKYVQNVLKILEMEPYADAVIGVPGSGLNVEQRKRLTIGVELAAKPKLLLFLDEPTSGLDSQTAWSICQLIKKLSNAGQAVLCTIHQPSALLLEQFDRLLFLAKGGKTVYFGDIGPGCSTLIDYFVSKGSQPCAPDANPAEWILDVVGAAPGSHALKDWPDEWLRSPERQAVRQEIDRLMKEFGASESNVNEDKESQHQYAAPFWVQYYLVLYRIFQQYWRTPSYIWAKLALNIFAGLFNGFVFFKADNSLQGMQNLMFSIFMFTVALPSVIQQYLPVYGQTRDLYEARERPSKIFSWQAFVLAILSAEIPWQLFIGTLSFLCWYYPAGLYANAEFADQKTERGGLTYFYILLFFLFAVTLGQLCAGALDDVDTATNIAMMLFTLTMLFSGVLATEETTPRFWIFMLRISPVRWWIGGMLALGIGNAKVQCADNELLTVYPPDGQSCASYLNSYFNQSTGYLASTGQDGSCKFCSVGLTNVYLSQFDISYHDRWRNLGFFWSYIAFNIIGMVILYWLARVPKKGSRKAKVTEKEVNVKDMALEEANAAQQ